MTTVEAPAKRELAYVQAINEAITQLMRDDPNIFLAGEDVALYGGVFGTSRGLLSEFGPERVVDTPIAESGLMGLGLGAAATGLRPIIEIMFMDFMGVCMDQIANHAAKLRYMSGGRTNVPITVCTVAGGGRQFGAQHSQSLEGWMMHTPGLKVVIPSSPADAKGLFTASIRDDDPVIFVEHMAVMYESGEVPDGEYVLPLGKADIKRAGSDVTIISYGRMMPSALAAAEQLAGEGTSAEVLDLRCLVPFDRNAILESVGRTGRAVVVNSAPRFAGPGAEIASLIHEELFGQLHAPVRRLGAAHIPIPFATELETATYPDVDGIEGLSPAISIDQKTTSRNPRSTVGTVTEIYDYLRLLWARIGVPHCPECGAEITGQTQDYLSKADSGSHMHRRFCPVCGTQVFSAAEERPNLIVVRAGTLDDPSIAAPQGTIWTASAPPWARIDLERPHYTGQPPAAHEP